jgi:excisionase family DNA binding protein
MVAENIGRNEALIFVEEAAVVLGVSRRLVYRWLREGTLRRRSGTGMRAKLSADEVQAFHEARLHPTTVAGLQRELLAERIRREALERRIERMERLLLLQTPIIGDDKAGLIDLTQRACYALKEPPTEVLEITEWCSIFLSLQEETFHLIEVYTDNPEPWAPFLVLAEKIYEDCRRRLYDPEIKAIYAELSAARRTLRQVVFFMVARTRNEVRARGVVPEMETDVIRRINKHVRS